VDITAWLHRLGLEQYEQAFRENDIDAQVLLALTADDLITLSVKSVGHRRKLLEAIAALRPGASTAMDTGSAGSTSTSVSAATSGDAERRQLTVMFCDLVGSTAGAEARAAHGRTAEIDAGAEGRGPPATCTGRNARGTRAQLRRGQEHDFATVMPRSPRARFGILRSEETAPPVKYSSGTGRTEMQV
jgi:hypothetical protein